MKVISSQHYLDMGIVDEKMAELEGKTSITFPCYEVGEDVEDGTLVILFNGHHTLAAARELGIKVEFTSVAHPEGLAGERLLEDSWNDGDWYFVETSNPMEEQYDFIW